MAYILVKDAAAATQAVTVASGDGTTTTPFITAQQLLAGSAVIGHVILDAGTAAFGKLAANSGVIIGDVNIAAGQTIATTNAGTFAVQATLAAETTKVIGTVNIAASQTVGLVAGSALVGKVGIDQTTPGTTNAVVDTPCTSGGLSSLSALSTGAVYTAQVKGSAGQVYSLEVFNLNAAARFVRLYNQTGAPASTDGANIIWRGIIPGNTAGAGFVVRWDKGLACSTGIGIRATAAVADNDTTILAANELVFNVEYK